MPETRFDFELRTQMQRHIHLSLIAALLILLSIDRTLAQESENASFRSVDDHPRLQSTSVGLQRERNEFGIWGAISFHSASVIGRTPDAKFGNIGLRYGRVLLAKKTVALEWTIDAVPLAILSNSRPVMQADPTGRFIFTRERKSVYGWGVAPIGLKVNFRRNHRLQPFGQATGGFLYFSEPVPQSDAARFNFTLDFSGGVQVFSSNRRAFTVGYKFQHVSNGNRAPNNLGVDVQMIQVGFSVFR